MPFTTQQFLEVFRHYNLSVFPSQIILFVLASVAIFFSIKKSPFSDKVITSILSIFWLWMGVVYHLTYFTAINKAAYLFGALFILQGMFFAVAGVFTNKLSFRFQPDFYGITGVVFILYALSVYPVLGYFQGHIYPSSPTFGLPCPTTIFTFGILLWAGKKFPKWVLIIPFLWSIVGLTAVISLAMIEDIGLPISALTATILIIIRSRKAEA